jgi:hypothetical protein
MDISEIINLHARTKGKINLAYKRASGRIGHCYLNCDEPLKWGQWDHHRNRAPTYGTEWMENSVYAYAKDMHVEVVKQCSKARIMVKPEDLMLQNERKGAMVKVLYGNKQEV